MGKFTDPELKKYVESRIAEDKKSGKSAMSKKGFAGFAEEQKYKEKLEAEYFRKKDKELGQQVENFVKNDPEKYGMQVKYNKKGDPVGYTLINKQKLGEMNAKLATAKTPKEKEKIKNEYSKLTTSTIDTSMRDYTEGGAGKYKNRVSNAQGRTQMGPLQLQRFAEGKPFTEDHNELGVRAKATTGKNNFLGSAGQALEKAGGDIQRGVSKAATSAYKNVGDVGSQLVKTAGKGVEGVVANTGDILEKAAQGDFKGMGKEALELAQTGKDIIKGTAKAGITAGAGTIGTVGAGLSDKNIKGTAQNIQREGSKGVNTYGDVAIDLAANAATGGAYGAAKAGVSGLAQGGLGGLVDSKALQDMAISGIASQAGIDPNLVKTGLAASKGDLKGAVLSGLGSYGIDPKQIKLAEGLLSGDKNALVSSLASQAGAGESTSNVLGSLAGGKDLKSSVISETASQVGLDRNIASQLGGDMDLKKMALEKLSSLGGVDPKLIENVSKGKFDPAQLAQLAGVDSSKLLGGVKDTLGISSLTSSPEAREMMDLGTSGGRSVQEIEKNIQAANADVQSSYKIAKGDSFNAIAKKLGITPEQLKAANPQIKDINKISAGANLNIPSSTSSMTSGARKSITDKYLKDASGKTIMGPNNAPIPNPSYNEQAADELAMQQQGATGATTNLPQESGFWDKVKQGAGALGGAVASGLGSVKDFAAENKTGLSLAADAAAAGLGYKAQQEAFDTQKKLTDQQLRDLQAQGKKFESSKLDTEGLENIYDQMLKTGETAETARAAKLRALERGRGLGAALKAGQEVQMRQGTGATGGGAGLAAALAAGQGVYNTEALQGLDESVLRQQAQLAGGRGKVDLSSQEADLARQQGIFGLDKTNMIGGVRGAQGQIASGRADALSNMYGKGADLANTYLSTLKTQPEKQMQSRVQEAAVRKLENEAGITSSQPAVSPQKTAAAAAVANRGIAGQPVAIQKQPPKTAVQQMNQRNTVQSPQQPMPEPGKGQGYGVLAPAQQVVQKGTQVIDQAKKKVEDIQKNPLQAGMDLFKQWQK